MTKKRTKIDLIKEQIEKRYEDIWLMEIVRDFNKTKGTPKGDMEVDAASKRIVDIEMEITFLKGYLAYESKHTEKA